MIHFKLLEEDTSLPLLERLLKIRGIEDPLEDFLNPTFKYYRKDPFLFEDMSKAVERILQAIKNWERIVVFGDYDVDGITSSFTIFYFIRKFLWYQNITIRLPSRLKDGYGIKPHHVEEIANLWASLLITVDNWTTAYQPLELARKKWIDVIITDHHHAPATLPQAYAIINPNASSYPFKGLAGVGVAFKLCSALASKTLKTSQQKKQFFDFFLPIVALGTVADIVPLLDENRLFVKKWLELLNQGKWPQAMQNFIKHLKLKNVDTYHMAFLIAPRLNAWGRMQSPYDALKTLLYATPQKRQQQADSLENLNNQRKNLQDQLFKKAEKLVDLQKPILIAASEDFHEGIIGLIAGKLTEKYNKPSVVLSLKPGKWIGVASLRSPEYFSVIQLLEEMESYLLKFGGHSQAGGFTVELENLQALVQSIYSYWEKHIDPQAAKKVLEVDTVVSEKDADQLPKVPLLAPFGEGNPAPVLYFPELQVQEVYQVGKNGSSHLKILAQIWDKQIPVLFRGKGELASSLQPGQKIAVIGKIKTDDFNGGFFVDGIDFEVS